MEIDIGVLENRQGLNADQEDISRGRTCPKRK